MDEMERSFIYQSNLKNQEIDGNRQLYAQQLKNEVQVVQAAIIEQTNPKKILEDIELKLSGLRYNFQGKLIRSSEPIMNERGISRMIFLLSSIVNQHTILSHLEDKDINSLIIKIGDDIVDDLTLNSDDYDVRDKMMLDFIVDAMVIPSFIALKRALKQNEKNWLNRTVVESVSNAQRPMPRRDSFIDRFKM